MNPYQFNNGNNPNMNDIYAVNQMILQNQYMLMNQINYLNNMNNQLMQNMNMNMAPNMNMNMTPNMNMNISPNMNMTPNMNMNMTPNMNMNNFNNMTYGINITFKSPNQQPLTINTNYDEKISSVISKYKILINDSSNNKDYFYCNKKIFLDLTVGEQGLTNNCEIEVREKNANENNNANQNNNNIPSNNEEEKYKCLFKKVKDNAFNDLKSGINILGKCCNKKCRFKDKQVISKCDEDKFEFVSNLYNVVCPHCSYIIIPRKIAFYQCKFIISGKKVAGDNVVPFSFNNIIETNDNKYFYLFDPENDKDITYIEILCQVYR